MRCLVTGATGLIGSHLVEQLLTEGQDVRAIVRKQSSFLDSLNGECHQSVGDICDLQFVESTIKEFKPDVIYHLAAQSQPNLSWQNPMLTYRVNIEGTHNVFMSVCNSNLDSLIVFAGSSAEYAPVKENRRIDEACHLKPNSIYGITKASCYYLSQLYYKVEDLRVICVRPFFLIGPRKKGDVSSDLASSIVSVERGLSNNVKHGNLEAVRDFLDVRDGARAFRLIAERGVPGEVYNICSGVGLSLSDIFSRLCEMSTCKINAEEDPDKFRILEEKERIGDCTKIKSLGWSPRFTIKETLKNILEYWRIN